MKFRKLQIAWSVGCGLACALCIGITIWLQNPVRAPPPPFPAGNKADWDLRVGRHKTIITVTYPYEPKVDRRQIRTVDYLGFSRQYTWHHLLL